MSASTAQSDESTLSDLLAAQLASHAASSPDFWDFENVKRRSGAHALFQYPAMMVPELQRVLLEDLKQIDPSVNLVYDPFMGSGTIMLECLKLGLNFHGSDINPMAVLLTHVKANPPKSGRVTLLVSKVADAAEARSTAPSHEFLYRDKWFTPKIRKGLEKLRSSIIDVSDIDERRFLWVCLAETIRLISNSRTSTVKLHTYTTEQIQARAKLDAIRSFRSVALKNAAHIEEFWKDRGAPGDSPLVTLLRSEVREAWGAPGEADAIMTSPPYGDNQSTVTYGQHSYLALQWIPTTDLVGSFDPELTRSTHRIDTLSLGGSMRHALDHRVELESSSASLASLLPHLRDRRELEKKVLAFFRDYKESLEVVSSRLRHGGFSFWTLGQRRVGGHEVPLVAITAEFLEASGHRKVAVIERSLPLKNKRMGTRNRQSTLMATETILVMQKADGPEPAVALKM